MPSSSKRSLKVMNPESPAMLLEEAQTSLRAYIFSLTANPHEVDDLLQETNQYLVSKLDEFTPGTNFKAWAFSVARYRLLSLRRDQERSKVSYFADEMIELLSDSATARVQGEGDRLHALRHCLSSLGTGERTLLRKFYVEKVSMTDLARKLERTANALHKSISRIRQALRVCIERQTK